MNYKLKPGDTATITQADGETLTIRAYDDFTMVQAHNIGTVLKLDIDSPFIMAIRVIEKKEEKPTKRIPTRKTVQMRVTDEIVEFMKNEFSERVGKATIMDFKGRSILGVEIDLEGLTHSELMGAGMTYGESVHLLGK